MGNQARDVWRSDRGRNSESNSVWTEQYKYDQVRPLPLVTALFGVTLLRSGEAVQRFVRAHVDAAVGDRGRRDYLLGEIRRRNLFPILSGANYCSLAFLVDEVDLAIGS